MIFKHNGGQATKLVAVMAGHLCYDVIAREKVGVSTPAAKRKNAAHGASRGTQGQPCVSRVAAKETCRHKLLSDARGAQIVEFAVALPLLVVFVVGIFDFSGAFTLKQKLTNISRDAARFAAADPATDILKPNSSVPASVDDAYQAVLRYLNVNNINNCGITETASSTGPPSWTFSAPLSSAPCGLTIIINRGYYLPGGAPNQPAPANCVPATATSGVTQVVATCVSIQYSYQWRFGKAASLLGSATRLPPNITATSIAMNEN